MIIIIIIIIILQLNDTGYKTLKYMYPCVCL